MTTRKGPLNEDLELVSVGENRLSMLERAKTRVAQEIDTCHDMRSLVLLTGRLQSLLSEISELAPLTEVSPADEIRARRELRRKRRHPA